MASAAEIATRTASAAVSVDTPRTSRENDGVAPAPSALGADSDRATWLCRRQRLHRRPELRVRLAGRRVLMVFLLDVDLPQVVALAEHVARRQDPLQHRVILVVVLVHAVAPDQLQLRKPGEA